MSFDGWAGAFIVGLLVAALIQYMFVQRPARKALTNAVYVVLMELSVNYSYLAYRRSFMLRALSFSMFDAHGPSVVAALDPGAVGELVALYAFLRLYVTAKPNDAQLRRALIDQRDDAKEYLDGVLANIKRLNLSLDRPIEAVRNEFRAAYEAPDPRPLPGRFEWLTRLPRVGRFSLHPRRSTAPRP